MFVLTYRGFRISSDPGAYELIDKLPIPEDDREALWGLWCCADAIVLEYEHQFDDPSTSVAHLFCSIEETGFRDANPERPFEDVIKWMRLNEVHLGLTVAPDEEVLERTVTVAVKIKGSRAQLNFARAVIEREVVETIIENMLMRDDHGPILSGLEAEAVFGKPGDLWMKPGWGQRFGKPVEANDAE